MRIFIITIMFMTVGMASPQTWADEPLPTPAKVTTMSQPQNNTWHQFNSSDTVFIFVHGIFSDSAGCWTADSGTFWPTLLNQDDRFGHPSIFLGGYFTDFSSGIYRISNAADELLSYLSVPDHTWKVAPLVKQNIVFVAHSTGGIVVRYMLERNKDLFSNKNVGLVLLASPSRGTAWSNRLGWLRGIFKNRMAGQLSSDNDFVLDLDSRFAEFAQRRKIRNLVGIDAFENKFIVPGWFFNSTHVVSATDSASYFGAPRIIPDTDHFSIAKPTSISHPSHQLLYEFYETMFKPMINTPVTPPNPTPVTYMELAGNKRFIAYHDGTVLDTKTNLLWAAKDNANDINWLNAKRYCENYRAGGYTDWRMPTKEELAGLCDSNKPQAASCNESTSIYVATDLIKITCFASWTTDRDGDKAAYFFFDERRWEWGSLQFEQYNRVLPVRSR